MAFSCRPISAQEVSELGIVVVVIFSRNILSVEPRSVKITSGYRELPLEIVVKQESLGLSMALESAKLRHKKNKRGARVSSLKMPQKIVEELNLTIACHSACFCCIFNCITASKSSQDYCKLVRFAP